MHPLRLTLLAALACASAHAQSIVAFAPSTPLASTLPGAASSPSATPAERAEKTAGDISPSSALSALTGGLPLFKRGPVTLRPHIQYRFVYGDGIEAGPGNQRDTAIHSISPGLLAEIGKYWRFDYTPSWTFYSNEAFRDTSDHTASLAGRVPAGRWILGAAHSYETSHTMLIETGRQTRQEKHSTSLDAIRPLGQHTRLELNVARGLRYANAVTDAPEWTTSDWLQWSSSNWLRYQVSPRLDFAAGLSVGYSELSVGDDMSSSLPQAQITWRPTEKITLSAQGGVESRRFKSGNQRTLNSPVYSASVGYSPFSTTKLTLDANRGVSASYFANEITKGQGWSVGVQQRFVKRLFLATSYSQNNTDYLATRQLQTARREDRYRAFTTRLTTVFFGRTTFALIFQTGENTSDESAYAFTSTQYGCELSHRF